MTEKKVLSIGQCCADHSTISNFLTKKFNAVTINADTSKEAFSLLNEKSFDLILVNRIFDTNGEAGLDFIVKFSNQGIIKTPIMLVSNFDEAQKNAINKGAKLGFGKAAISAVETCSKLEEFLGKQTSQSTT